jgi:hypothetical protein
VDGSTNPVFFVAWAPDGSTILYAQRTSPIEQESSDFDLVTISPDGSNRTVLKSMKGVKMMPPVWSPDGQQIAFATWDYNPGKQVLRVMNADGSHLHVVTDNLARGAVYPAWRPTAEATPLTTGSPSASATTAAEAQPTPDDSGRYIVKSFAEAQQIAPFNLVGPQADGLGLTLTGIELSVASGAAGNTEQIDRVDATYRIDSEPVDIIYRQSGGGCAFDRFPWTYGGRTEVVMLDGHQVVRSTATTDTGVPLIAFQWEASSVCYEIIGPSDATMEAAANVGDLVAKRSQQLAEAVSQSEGGTGAVPPAGITTRPVLTISPDYGTCDAEVTLHGDNFLPGSAVSLYGGEARGHNPVPLSGDVTVQEDGSFTVPLDLTRLVGKCGNGNTVEFGESVAFRISASTGSSMTKADDNITGPSAQALFTFADSTPAEVVERQRYPSCGTEVVINAWDAPGERTPMNVEARQCLYDAWQNRAGAEFVSVTQTTEGDLVTTIYQATGAPEITVFEDATQDQFGSGAWTTYACGGMTIGEDGTFQFASCGEPVVMGDG